VALGGSRAPPSDAAPPYAAPQASSLFCQKVLQRRDVQHRFRQQLLQTPVLVIEAVQTLRVRWVHPAVLRLPAIEGLLADSLPAADLRRRRTALCSRSTPMICASLNPQGSRRSLGVLRRLVRRLSTSAEPRWPAEQEIELWLRPFPFPSGAGSKLRRARLTPVHVIPIKTLSCHRIVTRTFGNGTATVQWRAHESVVTCASCRPRLGYRTASDRKSLLEPLRARPRFVHDWRDPSAQTADER
jgi:hypothetical protein